jgi:hypothetical protein
MNGVLSGQATNAGKEDIVFSAESTWTVVRRRAHHSYNLG